MSGCRLHRLTAWRKYRTLRNATKQLTLEEVLQQQDGLLTLLVRSSVISFTGVISETKFKRSSWSPHNLSSSATVSQYFKIGFSLIASLFSDALDTPLRSESAASNLS